MTRPLLIALQFLTRLPVSVSPAPEPRELGQSLLWYPLVGLLIGGLLYGLDATLAPGAPQLLRAALVLAAWVSLTGALHLDGLADSADAWIGGRGERDLTLRIMKDPHAGPAGVTAIVVLLLLKLAALDAVPAGQRLALILPPFLARSAVPALFACTRYVRPDGIASAHAASMPRAAALVVASIALCAAAIGLGSMGLAAVATASIGFVLLRAYMLRWIDGTTGDTAGAMIELLEAAVLVSLALYLPAAAP
jgi:adenosylcobinamide-GDP ribazoletransferase